jgi:hypothetical protein
MHRRHSVLVVWLALGMAMSCLVDAKAQNTCSHSKAICENVCWQRMGLAQLDCRKQCNEQFASCLKTGVFKTREVNSSGLEKK